METNTVKNESAASANPIKRQVKIQLTRGEFLILYALLADATSRPSPEYDMYEKLLHHIMIGVYKKFLFAALETRCSYTIALSFSECIAFWIYWTDHSYSNATPAGKVLDRINNFILLLFSPDPYN